MAAFALPLPYSTWRHFFWRHPEWWALSLSCAAWLSLFVTVPVSTLFRFSAAAHPGHAFASTSTAGPVPIYSQLNSWLFVAVHWLVMIAAMMFPAVIGQLRFVAARSLWSRRELALALFLAGYTGLWLVFGLLAETVLILVQSLGPRLTVYLVPVCFMLAAFWQVSRQKRHNLAACHLTAPLAVHGWRASYGCFRHGVSVCSTCFVSCWALMLACAASIHALWALLVVTAVVWSERLRPYPRQFFRSLVLLLIALCSLAF
ncbi:MAG TPA: DUF2182 domain-containing protein [Candidatus Acidoferrum sp.]|nr:DUF2182 domain-containing protein [Candidatus Acidoferrum sp.]